MPRVRDFIVKACNFITNTGDKAQKVDKETAPNSIMSTSNNNEKQTNNDTFESSASNFEKYCKRNKVNEAELSAYVRGSYKPNDKMNSSKDDIAKAKQCLEAAYKHLADDNGDVDTNELKELAEQYYIAINTGWSIEEFQNEQNQTFKINHSVSSAYKKFCLKKLKFGKLFAKDITADIEFFQEYIKNSFVDIDKDAIKNLKAQGNNNPTEEEILAEKKQLQIKIFGRMLANTKIEDRDLLMKAVKDLYCENRYNAAHATLGASHNKTKASRFYLEDRHEICKGLNENETMQMQELGYHYASKNDAEHYSQEDIEYARKFFTENNINPDELQEKLNSGASLSDAEQQAAQYLSMLSGAQIGIGGNVVMSNQERNDVMTSYNQGLQENNFYETVTQKSSSYIEQNEEASLITKEEFVKQINSSLPEGAKALVLEQDKAPARESGINNKTSAETNTKETLSVADTESQTSQQAVTQRQASTNKSSSTHLEKESTSTNPFITVSQSTQTENKDDKKQVTAETLIEKLGTVKAVASAAGNNNYKQSVVNDLMAKFEKANIDTKSQMISAANFDGAGTLIRATSQNERIELVQADTKLNSTRKTIIEKQYIYNKDSLYSSKTTSVA